MLATLKKALKSRFVLFLLLGFMVTLVIVEVLFNWIAILAVLYGKPNLGYHDLPSFIHLVQGALRWPVPLILVGITIADIRSRNFMRTGGYITGAFLATVAWYFVMMFRYVAAMSEF